MPRVHEKRAARVGTALIHERKPRREDINSVKQNCTRTPWSEQYSIRLDGWSAAALLTANVGVVVSTLSMVAGGPGA